MPRKWRCRTIIDNDNDNKQIAKHEEFTETSLKERIKRALENAKAAGNDLYDDDTEHDIQLSELERIEEGFKAFNKKLVASEKNRWGYSPSGYMSKALVSKHLNSVKTGLYAIYPIPCKQGKCPYGSSCIALQNNIQPPYGEPCVIETNRIENLIIEYSQQFNLDSSSTTDRIQIKELIQLDILMDRCQILMAQDVDILQDIEAGMTDKGEVFTQPVVSRYYDAWERMSKRRQSIMNDMMATRRSKKGMPEEIQNDADIILGILDNQEDFMKVEERPEKFKKEDETIC